MAETYITNAEVLHRIETHPDMTKETRFRFRHKTRLVYSTTAKHEENVRKDLRRSSKRLIKTQLEVLSK